MRVGTLLLAVSLPLLFVSACASAASPTQLTPGTARPSSTAVSKASQPSSQVTFAGKTITVVVPLSAGGGTDIVARVVARHLPKFLPGNPTMIVRNMPGADATIGSNYAYFSKPDGLTILASSGTVLLSQLFGNAGARYDVRKMPAFVSFATAALYYTKTSIVSRPEDILKAKGVVFGTSAGGNGYGFLYSVEVLGMPVEKVVLAYTGVGDARRAFLAGEINSSTESGSGWNDFMKPYADKGDIVPLFQTGLLSGTGDLIKDPSLPTNVITVKELHEKVHAKSPSGLSWDAYKSFVAANFNYLKTYLLSPGTPDSIVRAYWDASTAMLKDTDFHKVADPTLGQGILSVAGEAADKEFKQNYQVDPKIVEWLKGTALKYGIVIS
ncbi:MAG: hypothetical protein HYX90_07930 [Chloroflexi bacterium]|nr:hypothetical protein [Chloroflexota bacterium]